MNTKTQRKITIIATVAILMLAILAVVVFQSTSTPIAHAAATSTYFGEYDGDQGTLDGGHRTTNEQVAAAHGVTVNEVTPIIKGEDLYKFLNGDSKYSTIKVGYLTADVGISYNVNLGSDYYNAGVNSSNAIFDKIFDGNGYTVKIYGGVGTANSVNTINDDAARRKARRNNAAHYGRYDAWYEYTGYLVAENYGKIVNVTVDYESPHMIIKADKGEWGSGAPLDTSPTTRLLSRDAGGFCAGIVTGLNGYNGVIENVKLQVNTPFTTIKLYNTSKKLGWVTENYSYAGGIAGRIEDNSTVYNCWVDLESTGGIYNAVEGKSGSLNIDEHYGLSVVGGVVGNIDVGTAKLQYCAISGSGDVKSFINRAVKGFYSYAGGVAGGCVEITNLGAIADLNMDENVAAKANQVQGIISSWKGARFDNYQKEGYTKKVMGLLFDAIGTEENVKSLAIMYDLEAWMDSNEGTYKPTSQETGKVVCDSSGNLLTWLEIYPTSDGGRLLAKFDIEEGSAYDIRVHAIADGHDNAQAELDAVDMSQISVPYYQLMLKDGESGGIIWSAKFLAQGDDRPSSHIDLTVDDPMYGEIYMLNSARTGKYNYEFGKMGTLAYEDTNGSDGSLYKTYNGEPLKLPKVLNTSSSSLDTSVFESEDIWIITFKSTNGNSSQVKLGQTYMPGNYTMTTEKKLGDDRTYGYYNEERRVLAWQVAENYSFTILQGTLSYGSRTTSTDGWQKSVTFELKMNAENDFDKIRYQRGGTFPEDTYINRPAGSASVLYTVDKGTGKNGADYVFYAYKWDPVAEKDVVVAVSESKNVRIDTDAPEISDVKYYMVEEGSERLLTDDDFDDIKLHWTKNPILAKFSVSDNGKSGLGSLPTASYINYVDLQNGDYEVVVSINDSLPKTLKYVDAQGNYAQPLTLQFNVDTVQGKFTYLYDTYQEGDGLSFSREDVFVNYRATFGLSGWKMYYSYQKDSNGEDIWVARADQDQMVNSGAYKNFVINWNMGDVRHGEKAAFKIKMVNIAGLYDDVYPVDNNDNPFEGGKIGDFIIWRRIADIYISNELDNIFLDGVGEKLSLKDILSGENASEYFDKEYDGTTDYDGKKAYKFYMDVSDIGAGFSSNDKIGVLYTTAYYNSRPAIENFGVNGKLPVLLEYNSIDSGKVTIRVSVPLSGDDYYNYAVYFTDLTNIDFEVDIEAEYGTYSDHVDIPANIKKITVEIDLSKLDEFEKSYIFGDEIPTSLEVEVAKTNAVVPITLTTEASSTANKGDYVVSGATPKYANVEYVVFSTMINIAPRSVDVELRYDGGEVGNIPTGEQAGASHHITGTYKDVNGEDISIVVKYYLNGQEEEALAKVGLYNFELSIENPNYVIDGPTRFKFVIQKGYLKVTMGAREVDYTEGQIKYVPSIPKDSEGLYLDDEIIITYYRYRDGVSYDSVTGQVTGIYDRENPFTEAPIERGIYYVEAEFVGNNNFFKSSHVGGNLIIVKAGTFVNVDIDNLQYSFENRKLFSFDVKAAVTEVRSSCDNLLWESSRETDGAIKVYYQSKDDGRYIEVPQEEKAGEGWYSEVGTYRYKIEYVGNDDYNKSEIIVNMTITHARFKNISFSQELYESVYDGKNHLPEIRGLGAYPDIEQRYQNRLTTVSSLDQFNFVNVGEYEITLYVNADGFEEFSCKTKVVITKAKFSDSVSVDSIIVDYDGQDHYVTIKGLKGNLDDGLYYEDGITAQGVQVIVSGNTEGVTFAKDVKIDPATGKPTNYSGTIVLSANNYEDKTLNTYIEIRQIELNYTSIGTTIPRKIPSGTSVKDYYGYFELNERTVKCELAYYDESDVNYENRIMPDENGALPDGKYRVRLVLTNNNYKLESLHWKLEVGEINNSQLTTYGIIAVGAVAGIMLIAIITAIVVVKKRKRAGIV